MGLETTDRLQAIADARDVPKSEIRETALERGLEALWQEVVIEEYLDGERSRDEAIEVAGLRTLERAERERDFVEHVDANRDDS